MFDLPQRNPKQEPISEPFGWEYLEELKAIADWLSVGPDHSPELAAAVAGMDTFRGTPTVRRWLHNVATAHTTAEEQPTAYLDRLVEGRLSPGRAPSGPALENEIEARLKVLESVCTIPDNYRCALLLKEGSGLTVERTAFLMGVSKASLRSILYRARRAIGS
ncbi:MAG: sigma factor-like helix-turn-helix DNA-binding protein [Acidimicrobiia bacterium]